MSTVLLFTATSDFLGEVRLWNGALDHVMLTVVGEETIGPRVREWQTHGVPAADVRIQPRESEFQGAVCRWCEGESLSAVTLPSSVHEASWSMLSGLPYTSRERLALLTELVHAKADELIKLQAQLRVAQARVVAERNRPHVAARPSKKRKEGRVRRKVGK